MDDWKSIQVEHIVNIEKVAAEFHVSSIAKFPFLKCKIKILEDRDGKFTGVPNLRIKNHNDDSIDGVVGLGDSITSALEDAIRYLVDLINEYEELYNRELLPDDFMWSDPTEF